MARIVKNVEMMVLAHDKKALEELTKELIEMQWWYCKDKLLKRTSCSNLWCYHK